MEEMKDEELHGLKQPLSLELREKRMEILRERLLNITNSFHEDFLRSVGIEMNPFEIKCWHHAFRVHEIPEISEGILKEKPDIERLKWESLGDYLKKHENENDLVKEAIQKVHERKSKEAEEQTLNPKINSFQKSIKPASSGTSALSSCLSASLLQKVSR